MRKIATVLWLFSASSLVFSQGVYLEKNMSGLELGASLSGQTDKSYLGQARIGYSFFGIFDAGFSLGPGKTYQNIDGIAQGQNYFAFSPSFAVYALKQDAQIPLSFTLNASYEFDAYYSDFLGQNNMALEGDIYSFGASIYRNFPLSEKVKLLANAGIKYRIEHDVLEYDNGFIASSNNDFPTAAAGCDMLFKQHNNNTLRIGAGIGYDYGNNRNNITVTVSVSVVMPRVIGIVRRHYPRRYILVPADMITEYPKSSSTHPESSEPDTIVINVPNSKGGFVPVKLVRSQGGYIGPQGEFYPNRPTIEQLKALYGD